MSKANAKLRIEFEFDLAIPESLLERTREDLCRSLAGTLGSMVFQGMPTVTGKQLGKAGIRVLAHHHHMSATETGSAPLPREALVAAAPHLTDDEFDQLERRARAKAPEDPAALHKYLRRHALAMNNEYRMVACAVQGLLSSGTEATLPALLNLTNGSVLIDEKDRQKRLKVDHPLTVRPNGLDVELEGSCAGHTLSGPVIEVSIAQIARHRDALLGAWHRA